jgi:2-polyprenyl-3-methyl-5-hydroxy-6-metoxy-1,4-benzoquinol methylase
MADVWQRYGPQRFAKPGNGLIPLLNIQEITLNNQYDKLIVDIEQCHNSIELKQHLRQLKLYDLGVFHRISCNIGLNHRLVDAGFSRYWFDEFSLFWSTVFCGRPLRFHDFFYLYSNYRTLFQQVEVSECGTAEDFLYAWQRHENIYLIFGSVYRDALEPFAYKPFLPYIRSNKRILEYGCGLAPIVTSMIRSGLKDYSFTIADIKNYTFAYAKWRLMQYGVECINLNPFQKPQLTGDFDVIFLMTVLEHLPDPLDVLRHLTSHLKTGGYLILDYILSEGKGLDTLAGRQQRSVALDFLRVNYSVTHGALQEHESMGTTVLIKI